MSCESKTLSASSHFVLNQSTHSRVANSTASACRHEFPFLEGRPASGARQITSRSSPGWSPRVRGPFQLARFELHAQGVIPVGAGLLTRPRFAGTGFRSSPE